MPVYFLPLQISLTEVSRRLIAALQGFLCVISHLQLLLFIAKGGELCLFTRALEHKKRIKCFKTSSSGNLMAKVKMESGVSYNVFIVYPVRLLKS